MRFTIKKVGPFPPQVASNDNRDGMLINRPPHRITFSLPPFPVIPRTLEFLGKTALLAFFHRISELSQKFLFPGIFLSHSEVNLRLMTEWLLTDLHIHTTLSGGPPGHTSGSICIYEFKTKVLFTGNTVFAGGTPSHIVESGSVERDISTTSYRPPISSGAY